MLCLCSGEMHNIVRIQTMIDGEHEYTNTQLSDKATAHNDSFVNRSGIILMLTNMTV